ASTLVGVGEQRFRQIADAWRELTTNAAIDGAGPLLLGGFSFDPLRESTRLWDGFADARMVLPEQLLSIHDGAASLTTSVVDNKPRRIHPVARHAARGLSPEPWQELVATIERGIRDGELG